MRLYVSAKEMTEIICCFNTGDRRGTKKYSSKNADSKFIMICLIGLVNSQYRSDIFIHMQVWMKF